MQMRELVREVARNRDDFDILELSRDYSEAFETSNSERSVG